ncbi:MAG TPA: secretin N-terminal domain-containing protein [Planctomycetota bacterium]|nr:secretin N-terminal domain-containing protein [Planctomycetota bacterium]
MKRIAGIAVLGCLAGTLAFAQQPPKQDEKKLGGVLQDVNLHDLTVAVQRITKKTILWTEDLGLRNKRIHFVSDKPIADDPVLLFKAYQSILQVSDLVLVPAGEKGEEIWKIKPSPVATKAAVPVDRGEIKPPEDRFVTRIFQLQFVNPRNVQAALINMATFPQNVLAIEEAGIIIATDFDFNIRRFEEIVRTLDIKKPDIELKVIPLKFAIAQDIEQMMNGLVQTLVGRQSQPRVAGVPGVPGAESVKVVADKRTNAVVVLAEPNRLPQLEEIVRKLDNETQFETSGIYVSHLRHTNAIDIARTLNAMYRITIDDKGVPTGGSFGAVRPGQQVGPQGAPLPAGGGASSSPYGGGGGYGSQSQLTGSEPTIVADIRSNSVIMVTDRNTFKTLDQIVRRLDQRRPQVLIKATVVEIRSNDKFDLGVELNYLQDPKNRLIGGMRSTFGQTAILPDTANNVFNITPVDTPGIALLAFKDRIGNIPAMLKAIDDKAKVSILDEPEAATNDNGVATMKVTSQVPVLQTTITGTGVAQTTFNRFETAETTLSISPHISEGGYLRLETTVKIEKFTKESVDPTIPPPKTSREINTKEIMVPSGGTMVIGGIVTQDHSHSVQGVPILSQIPLIGFLFQREQESMEKRTLYIFLTPYILYDYGFGDYRDLTKDRKSDIERLRGEPLKGLSVDLKADKLPESAFRYQSPRSARKEEEK